MDNESVKELIDKYSPFFKEIRRRLFFTVFLFGLVTVAGFIYSEKIISFVVEIFGFKGINIVFSSPFQFVNLSISISLLLGVTVLFPLILFQIVFFLKPALKKTELHLILWLLPFSIILFIAGFAFGVFIMRYIVFATYIQAAKIHIGSFLDISNLLSEVLSTATIMGVVFEFPILITALMKLKVIKHHTLSKRRFWIYSGAALFAGLVPPADIPSTLVYFAVLILLFEATLFLNRMI
jgi:sec-independent protein translocase protein TatC